MAGDLDRLVECHLGILIEVDGIKDHLEGEGHFRSYLYQKALEESWSSPIVLTRTICLFLLMVNLRALSDMPTRSRSGGSANASWSDPSQYGLVAFAANAGQEISIVTDQSSRWDLIGYFFLQKVRR
jgi:hypothetical protein